MSFLIAILTAHLVVVSAADVIKTPLTANMLTANSTITQVTHKIYMKTITGRGHCSATAIGPYALLSASHCEEPTDRVMVDDSWHNIDHMVRDGYDHTIFYLADAIPFDQWARVKVVVPEQGSIVAMAGNPGMATSIYRDGTFAGEIDHVFQGEIYLFNFASFIGDSGAGLFAEDGTLFAVESLLVDLSDDADHPFKMPGAYPLHFTDSQWADALAFKPPLWVGPHSTADPTWLLPIPN